MFLHWGSEGWDVPTCLPPRNRREAAVMALQRQCLGLARLGLKQCVRVEGVGLSPLLTALDAKVPCSALPSPALPSPVLPCPALSWPSPCPLALFWQKASNG